MRTWRAPLLISFSLLFSFLFFAESSIFSGEKETPVQLFFTSDMIAYLKPCG